MISSRAPQAPKRNSNVSCDEASAVHAQRIQTEKIVMKLGVLGLIAAVGLVSIASTVASAQEERASAEEDRRIARSRSSSQTWVVDLAEDGECRVPAEEAGVLVAINAWQGKIVKAYQKPIFRTGKSATKETRDKEVEPLVQIDVSLPQRQRDVAAREWTKADTEAKNDVNERYSAKASDVSKFAYMKAKAATEKVQDSISQIEVMRLKLDWEASRLKIEQSAHERNLAELTAQVKREEYYAAEEAIDRRRLDSAIDGIVTDVYFRKGEWVKPGDTVLRIINLERLTVKGFLKRSEHNPQDVAGKAVTVRAALKGGHVETFTGKIKYVAQELLDGESYAVVAEVDNRKAEGSEYYLLQPGTSVDLEIEK
jgi:hypothetical protein